MSDNADNILPGRELLFQRSQQRAYTCLRDQEYSRAFAHFIVALTIQPDVDDDILDMFLYTLGHLANALEVEQNWQELLMCYEQSLDVLPYSSHILHGLATVLFRLGHIESAISYFQRAYKENPFFTPSLYCIDNIKNALVERWHFIMVNDRSRNLAFSEAIHRAVKDGYGGTVLDIGAGSGILSMIAANAGADKVFACEGNPMMFGVLQKVIEANSKNVQILPKFSFELTLPGDLPEKVSLVVTEIFDAGLFGENVLSTLKHAWENLINVGNEAKEDGRRESNDNDDAVAAKTSLPGKVIPQSATVWAVPMECESIRKDYWLGENAFENLEIANRPISATTADSEPYTTERLSTVLDGYKFLSSAKAILTANFCDLQDITSLLNGRDISTDFEITESGKLDAIAVWFDLHLDELTKISTEPNNEGSCWEQSVFCVLPEQLKGCSPHMDTGASIQVKFTCRGHLRLQSVKTASTPAEGDFEPSFSVDAFAVRSLNSYSINKILSLKLPSNILEAKSPIIDISSFPALGLKALKDGAEKLIILPSKYLMDIYKFSAMFATPKDKIRSMSYEDICCQAIESSAIICEPVEATGLLKKNIFEDIALLRTLSQKDPPCVFPQKISIFASLIESPALLKQARLTSDDNCLDFKVSQFLNSYQSVVQQDIQLCRLPHERLCDATKLCDIDLNKLMLEKGKLQSFVTFQGSTKVLIRKSGEVSGISFWFNLDYDRHCVVDTSLSMSRWKQAAIIPESKLDVRENESVTLEWTCRNSCLNISVKKE